MFYMDGTAHLLIDYEYFVIAGDAVLHSGTVQGFTPANARAFVKLRHIDISSKYEPDNLQIKIRRIADPSQTAFPFMTAGWSGI